MYTEKKLEKILGQLKKDIIFLTSIINTREFRTVNL